MDANLSGLQTVGGSMFQYMSGDPTPNPEEMQEEMNRALFNKTVKLKNIKVETYDLGDTKQAKAYAKMLETIYSGLQQRTHMILYNDRQFVDNGQDKARWIAHMEWAEFDLDVTANPITKGQKK